MSDLKPYRKKRDFKKTNEPAGTVSASAGSTFVIQKHDASHLHYDFRLELDGVLKSWAVPKGPSLKAKERRLAVHVEDHPLEYGEFEGVIPPGQYGSGTVMIWDRGTWTPIGDPSTAYAKGHLKFELSGRKLNGVWSLVRTKDGESGKELWLLIRSGADQAPVDDEHSAASGRTMDEIGNERDRVWDKREERPPPAFVEPQLATLATELPSGEGWLYELKYDGVRAIAAVDRSEVRLWTRNGQDWTPKLPAVRRALAALHVRDVVLDGELVVFDARGATRFGALQQALSGSGGPICYVAFDVLQHDGEDLRPLPLSERKARLRALGLEGNLRYAEHVADHGAEWLEAACTHELEGVIAKRADAPYRSGRTRTWLKIKCPREGRFVVVGYTDPGGARSGFGALHVAEEGPEGLLYVGKVGSGFDETALGTLSRRLTAVKTFAVDGVPRGATNHAVRPELRVRVRYTDRTDTGKLRHPVFLGAVAEAPRLTNPERVLWPDVGVTKAELAAWLGLVADRMLPQVARRPLTLVRCPGGVGAPCFFQRHHKDGMPAGLQPIRAEGHEEPLVWLDSAEGLVALAQMGVLEVHPWGSTIDRIDLPDRLIFDPDPDPALPWEALVHAAASVRARLEELDLHAWVRVTGGKGLHVVTSIVPEHPWEPVRDFCAGLARELARAEPDRFVAVASKERRKGRVFVDWMRNGRGATAVATWSPRARPGAPVCVPLRWEELPAVGSGDRYGLRALSARLPADPWPDLDDTARPLSKSALARYGARA